MDYRTAASALSTTYWLDSIVSDWLRCLYSAVGSGVGNKADGIGWRYEENGMGDTPPRVPNAAIVTNFTMRNVCF